MIPIGSILRELRDLKNLSQKQLAQRIGVTSSTIALYETGDRLPSLESLIALSRTLGVSTDYLLGLDREKRLYIDTTDLTPNQIKSLDLIVENYRNPSQ